MWWVRGWGTALVVLGIGACTSVDTPSGDPDGGNGATCSATQLACDDGQPQTWASCSADQCVTGGALSVLQPFESKMWSSGVALSADGKLLGVAGESELAGTTGSAALIDRSTGAVVHHRDQVTVGIAFSPDSKLVALGTNPVVVLSTSDYSEVTTLADSRGPVAFSPDGSVLAIVVNGVVKLFATSDWSEQGQVEHPMENEHDRLWAIRFSPDGKLIATSSGQVGFGSPHGMTRLWNRSDLSMLRELDCHTMDAAFSPDSQRLATACWQKSVVWDVTSGEVLRSVPANQTYAIAVAFTPDGQRLAVGTFGGSAQLFDLANGERLHVMADDAGKTPMPAIKSLQFDSSNGTLIGGVWNDTRAFVWTLPETN